MLRVVRDSASFGVIQSDGETNMKAKNTTESDERLRALLKEWKVEASLPARFREQVWRSIEREERQPSLLFSLRTVLARWINTVLPRPALAVSYVAILLIAGASVGWTQARQDKARVSDQLSLRYVRSVDPSQSGR